MSGTYVVLGAGVLGLTTAIELQARLPKARIIISAKYTPGDKHLDYCSPWAGANWHSAATDNGRQEAWDAVTFRKFLQLAENTPEAGVRQMGLRVLFDNAIEDAAVRSEQTGKIWYDEMCRLRPLPNEDVPESANFGFEMSTYQIDVPVYLSWLQVEAVKKSIQIHRGQYADIREVSERFPDAKAVFNCTGLGSYFLKGVEDRCLYPTRGQTLLVESPKKPLGRMYSRSARRGMGVATYIFPRGDQAGIVLGGCRDDGDWNGEVDFELAEEIKRRCCDLCPDLGEPQDLKVISHGVGLRPSRIGGPRVERERIGSSIVIHNYGAGGSGYQASWGMAKEAVDLLLTTPRL